MIESVTCGSALSFCPILWRTQNTGMLLTCRSVTSCPFDKGPAANVLSNFCPLGPSKLYLLQKDLHVFGGPMKRSILKGALSLLLLSAVALAQDLASFEKRVTVKKLPNGLTLIICERPEAPVFSFFTMVDAGSTQDPQGATGLAHMFEHMAFKGTNKIGTTNYPAERLALEKVEAAYAAYIRERDKRVGQDPAKLKQLEKDWQDAMGV